MIREKLICDSNFSLKDEVFFQNDFHLSEFESAYLAVREKEGRLLGDVFVRNLPDIPASHLLRKEWETRKESSQRLIRYLKKANTSKNILEIGCGNGWLANRLAKIPGTDVVGLDVNVTELKQAARVFNNQNNLSFIAGDIFSTDASYKFDYIILASSIQYFAELHSLLLKLLEHLSDGGEIHILDSPLYNKESVSEAKARSGRYFESKQSQMEAHYHHHCWDILSSFNYKVAYDPTAMLTRIKNKFRTGSPFPWIIVKKA